MSMKTLFEKLSHYFILTLLIVTVGACSSNKADEVKEEASVTQEEVVEEAVAPAVEAAEEVAADAENMVQDAGMATVTCKSGEDTRTIANVATGDNSCDVNYSKFGNTEKVAWAENDLSWCPKIQQNIQGNLEAAGFSCQ